MAHQEKLFQLILDLIYIGASMATSSRTKSVGRNGNGHPAAEPLTHQRGKEIQSMDKVVHMPIGLDEKTCLASVKDLNPILADTISLRDL
jgi:hypothetical protein